MGLSSVKINFTLNLSSYKFNSILFLKEEQVHKYKRLSHKQMNYFSFNT